MKIRKITALLLTLILTLGVCVALASCGGNEEPTPPTACTTHVDNNGDGVCDTDGCNEAVAPNPPPCTNHVDSDGDGVCDTEGCNETVTPTPPVCTDHTDSDGDGICDTDGCTEPVAPEEGGGEEGGEEESYFNEDGELILYKDGKPTFQFILGTSLFSSSGSIGGLKDKLDKLSAEAVVSGTTSTEAQPVEILFGVVTNRGDEYAIDIHSLGLNGYIVKQIGTKIVVIGGSADSMKAAVEHLEKNVFGIKKANDPFTDFVMESSLNVTYIQDDYKVTAVNVGTEPIESYTLTYVNGELTSKKIAEAFRNDLYAHTGIWLTLSRADKVAAGTKTFHFDLIDNDGEGGGFYFNIDKTSGNVTLECEYSTLFADYAEKFFDERIFADGIRGKVTLSDFNPNYRDIYYSDFGAVGDGETDDFFALKAAHAAANAEKLNVHADSDAVYYIGSANGSESIIVKTSTYWHGCTFIFDDEDVDYTSYDVRMASIFRFESDTPGTSFSSSTLPFTSLVKGQTNIGWAPGTEVMLILYNSNVRHYIRFGANADNGKAQHELIIVDAEGNVDPTTPIQWDYDTVTSMTLYYVDDRPIEIVGEGDNGEMTKIITRYNDGPAAYLYHARNLYITRSNMTISDIEHSFAADSWIPSEEGGKGSPYDGFTKVQYCSNVALDNFIIECPETYYSEDVVPGIAENPNGTNMGSYEIAANEANNVRYSNFVQSNFFDPDGSKKFDGCMGTNFCKNLSFDNMFTCSFDAHCGVYNGYIRNSVVDHLNFIGDGEIVLENVTVYTGGVGTTNSAVNLRYDYGSTWSGSLYVDGLTFKYPTNYIGFGNNPITIISATFANHFFGYTCHLPQNIVLKNVRTEEFTYSVTGLGNGNTDRTENHVSYNGMPVLLFSMGISEDTRDLSHPNFGQYGSDAPVNLNPTVATKTVVFDPVYTGDYADTDEPVTMVWPTSPTFKDTKYYLLTVDEWSTALNVTSTNLIATKVVTNSDGEIVENTTLSTVDGTKRYVDSLNPSLDKYISLESGVYYLYEKDGEVWTKSETTKDEYDLLTACTDYTDTFAFADFTFDVATLTYKCAAVSGDGVEYTDVEISLCNGKLNSVTYTDTATGLTYTYTFAHTFQSITTPTVG